MANDDQCSDNSDTSICRVKCISNTTVVEFIQTFVVTFKSEIAEFTKLLGVGALVCISCVTIVLWRNGRGSESEIPQ